MMLVEGVVVRHRAIPRCAATAATAASTTAPLNPGGDLRSKIARSAVSTVRHAPELMITAAGFSLATTWYSEGRDIQATVGKVSGRQPGRRHMMAAAVRWVPAPHLAQGFGQRQGIVRLEAALARGAAAPPACAGGWLARRGVEEWRVAPVAHQLIGPATPILEMNIQVPAWVDVGPTHIGTAYAVAQHVALESFSGTCSAARSAWGGVCPFQCLEGAASDFGCKGTSFKGLARCICDRPQTHLSRMPQRWLTRSA